MRPRPAGSGENRVQLIEGVLIACYAVGLAQAFLYVRGEMPLAQERIANALNEAYAAGYVGKNIMGTGFDCFDPASYTASTLIGAEQRRQRKILVDAMRREGFRNYFREWWHFSYSAPGRSYDFSIRSRITTAAH